MSKSIDLKVENMLGDQIRLLQARLIKERGENVTLSDTYEFLAKACGVNQSSLSLLKSNNYTPSLLVALKLSDFFKVSVNELFRIVRVGG